MRSGRVSNVQQLMRNRLPVDSNPVGTPAGGPADAVTADARERKAEAVAATAVPGESTTGTSRTCCTPSTASEPPAPGLVRSWP